MNLTLHSDYSLRILMYLAEHTDRAVATREISEAYGVSRNHLVRVVETLQSYGFVKAAAGRFGGVMLARDPADINIGAVVRRTEPNFRIVECFDTENNTCRILPACSLRGVLEQALESFFAVLDRYTLADLVRMKGSQRISDFLPVAALGQTPFGPPTNTGKLRVG